MPLVDQTPAYVSNLVPWVIVLCFFCKRYAGHISVSSQQPYPQTQDLTSDLRKARLQSLQGSPAKTFTMSAASEVTATATAEALREAAASEATEAPSPAETATSCAGTPASGIAPQVETGPGLPAENLCSTCRKPISGENSVVVARAVGKTPSSMRCKACHNLKNQSCVESLWHIGQGLDECE